MNEASGDFWKRSTTGIEHDLCRFDLGIAYREMELYDDAIGEFRMCLVSDSHRLESLHMMGQWLSGPRPTEISLDPLATGA